jgi:hypothetical protein
VNSVVESAIAATNSNRCPTAVALVGERSRVIYNPQTAHRSDACANRTRSAAKVFHDVAAIDLATI